jgi:hypothetical protein
LAGQLSRCLAHHHIVCRRQYAFIVEQNLDILDTCSVGTVQVFKQRRVDHDSWRDASHSRTNETVVTAAIPGTNRLPAIDYILDKVDNAAKMHLPHLLASSMVVPLLGTPKDKHGTVECLASGLGVGAWQHHVDTSQFALILSRMPLLARAEAFAVLCPLALTSHPV